MVHARACLHLLRDDIYHLRYHHQPVWQGRSGRGRASWPTTSRPSLMRAPAGCDVATCAWPLRRRSASPYPCNALGVSSGCGGAVSWAMWWPPRHSFALRMAVLHSPPPSTRTRRRYARTLAELEEQTEMVILLGVATSGPARWCTLWSLWPLSVLRVYTVRHGALSRARGASQHAI